MGEGLVPVRGTALTWSPTGAGPDTSTGGTLLSHVRVYVAAPPPIKNKEKSLSIFIPPLLPKDTGRK